jgi:flavin reductase (DIM6/NTAB) family NADH-FMN oxidoreductase RutF
MPDSIGPRELRDAFGAFATGVTVITAIRPSGEPVGVTVNSFASVSLEPPLVLWCLQSGSLSLDAFAAGRRFLVNVLAADQRPVALRFAGSPAAKFPPGMRLGPDAAPPRLPGCVQLLECVVESVSDAGDHRLLVGRVLAVEGGQGSPLLFHAGRFGRFVADAPAGKVDVWGGHLGEWS